MQWLNPAAFATPAPGTTGTLGRNAFSGPGFQQFDLQLSRTLPVKERLHLNLRVEVFNILNRVNFSNPLSHLPDATVDLQPGAAYTQEVAGEFGSLRSTVGRSVGLGTSRQIQLSARFEF